MEQKLIKWSCGDRENDTALTQVEAENADDAIEYIENEFEKDCKKKLGVPIEDFFSEYGECKLKKEDAEKLKFKAKRYLKDTLKLELSEEKTLITNVKSKPIKFLGVEILP